METAKPQQLLDKSEKPAVTMNTRYPKCPEDREDCLFLEGVKNSTCLHSPLIRNRKGEPVAGGCNVSNHLLHCTVCQTNWSAEQTDLEAALDRPLEWKLPKR